MTMAPPTPPTTPPTMAPVLLELLFLAAVETSLGVKVVGAAACWLLSLAGVGLGEGGGIVTCTTHSHCITNS